MPGADKPDLQCQYCGQSIEPQQAYVLATCNKDTCGNSTYHVW